MMMNQNQLTFHGEREMTGPSVERYVDMNDQRDRERFRDRDRRRERDRERERKPQNRRDTHRDGSLPPRDRERDRSRERYGNNDQENNGFSGGYDENNQYKEFDNREVFDYAHQRGSSERDRNFSRPPQPPLVPNYSGLGLITHGEPVTLNTLNRDHRDERISRDNMPRGEDKGGEKWMTDTPTNTILLRGLPPAVDEKDIRAELMMFGAPIKEVRLMKRKDTGVSRGFAFVEFQTIADAQRWMEHNQGQLLMLNQYTVNMYYSTPKTGGSSEGRSQDSWGRSDWICSKCGAHNFKRRDYCFKCSISKEESERTKEGDGFDQVGNNPCNTLILRGLDALTVEDTILASLRRIMSLPVKNIKINRDDLTGVSRGFGFVEMHSIHESTQLLDIIKGMSGPLEVDGKGIMVSYAKNTFSTVMATMSQPQTGHADGSHAAFDQGGSDYSNYYQHSGTPDANGVYYDEASGQYYDPATGQYYDYSAYYSQEHNTQSDTTNAAAAVAQAAIQQAQAAKQYQKQHDDVQKQIVAQIQTPKVAQPVTTTAGSTITGLAHEAQQWSQGQAPPAHSTSTSVTPITPSTASYSKYPIPDVSTYQFDETSGYYYDPTTGLYYDSNSQYYYNSQTGQFMYWDGEKQTYLPAPSDEGVQGMGEKCEEGKKVKDKDKKEKVKVAKKIAKDMEKWAKTLNAQKEAMKDFKKSFTPLGGRSAEERESAAADAGFAILEKRALEKNSLDSSLRRPDKKLMPPPTMPGKEDGGSLVASYGGDSDSDGEDGDGVFDETKMLDWTKMACLLCKRQFPSKEGLQRHVQLSDLHKKNMEELRKVKAASGAYRDRAKERRKKYGMPEPPPARKQAAIPEPYEQPTRDGLGADNVGSKLLQKMGWSEGQGLGKTGQGIVDPIQAMKRQSGAGLGARGSNYNINPGDSYKDNVKKVMYARYQDIQ